MPASRLKMSQQNVEFHAQPFISVCKRLIDLGVIIGSGYHVNPKSLGYRTCTYVGIKLEKGSMYKT